MIITLNIEDGKSIDVTVNDARKHDICNVGFIDADAKKEETCKWIYAKRLDKYYCGDHECGFGFETRYKDIFSFCPSCGKRIEVAQ